MIPLTNGKNALIDDGDVELLSKYKWSAVLIHNRWYATTSVGGRTTYMHRMILPDATEVDHKNRDGLDNRRENLRACTHSENIANSEFKPNVSGFRGVGRNRKGWRARLKVNKTTTHLGTYSTPEEAARVYDAEARRVFGGFAYQNFS